MMRGLGKEVVRLIQGKITLITVVVSGGGVLDYGS